MKTLTKRKSLMGFIYALVMLLPFSAILVRCLYVTFNKNAYQSYSNQYIEKQNLVNSPSLLVENNLYQINYSDTTVGTGNIAISVYDTNLYNFIDTSNRTIDYIAFINESYPRINIGFTDLTTLRVDNWNTFTTNFTFTLKSTQFNPTSQAIPKAKLYLVNYVVQSLDNAFDYSLYTFLNENGTGRLNLTDWFTDVFLNRTTHNMLYLNYVNWYMNYSLLVSCVYLLYSVLMWFLTFARYIINKPLKEEE